MKKFFGNIVCAVLGFAIACTMLLSGSLVFASSASLVGDVNGDGSVNPLDLVILARHLAKWEGYEELPYMGEETDATEFIITETPNQYFYATNGGVMSPIDYETDISYVGLQYLDNGCPTGEVFYFTCDELGIPAEDVDDYLNYRIALTNFNEDNLSFGKVILGDDPVRITNADVNYQSDNQRLVIDGIPYTAVETLTGSKLRNEILVYECPHSYRTAAKILLTNKDGDIIDENGWVVAVFAYESSTGAKYYYDGNNKVITAAKALEMYGVYVNNDYIYAYNPIISNASAEHSVADSMYPNAFEMYLFDDNDDGKYDRAFYAPIYMTVYYTFKAEIDDKEVDADGLVYTVYGETVAAGDVTYTNDTAKQEGAVSVFTYNAQLNKVNVIDVLEMKTGRVEKIDSTEYNYTGYGSIKVTVDGTTYELGYDGKELGYIGTALNGKTTDGAVMGATLIPYDYSNSNRYGVDKVATRPFIQYIVDRAAWIDDLMIDTYIGYYAYNGIIVYASELSEHDYEPTPVSSSGLAVVQNFANCDLTKIYLDLLVDGYVEKSAPIAELDGHALKDLSAYEFSAILSERNYYHPGTIYSFNELDGEYALSGIINDSNYSEYGLIDAKVAASSVDEIVFNGGSTPSDDRTTIIRTAKDTVFYFIENAECACNVPCDSSAPANTCNSINPTLRTVSTFIGQPEDATIRFDENTYIWVDYLGHGTAETNGRASVVFVINPTDYEGFVKSCTGEATYVQTNFPPKRTVIASAETLRLPRDYVGVYYMYDDAAISLDNGSRMTIYSKVELQGNRIYKVDENGVVYLKDAANFGAGNVLNDNPMENHKQWNTAPVVSTMGSYRNYVKYGITDVNGQASTVADDRWGEPNGTVRYYDYVWYSKANTKLIAKVQAEFAEFLAEIANMAIAGEISTDAEYAEALGYTNAGDAGVVKAFLADFVAAGAEVTADDIEFEDIPDSIFEVELVTPLLHADYVDDYVEVEILSGANAGTYLIDEDDHITDIIVVKQNGLGVVTGKDAIELLNSAPQVIWIGTKDAADVYGELFSEYLADGSILFVVGYANNDR